MRWLKNFRLVVFVFLFLSGCAGVQERYWYKKGIVYSANGRYKKALECFDKTISLNPSHCEALYNRGVVLYHLKKDKEALRSLQKAVELNPDYAESWYYMGVILEQEGKFDQGIQKFLKARELAGKQKKYQLLSKTNNHLRKLGK